MVQNSVVSKASEGFNAQTTIVFDHLNFRLVFSNLVVCRAFASCLHSRQQTLTSGFSVCFEPLRERVVWSVRLGKQAKRMQNKGKAFCVEISSMRVCGWLSLPGTLC
jgi:hypothetical protein